MTDILIIMPQAVIYFIIIYISMCGVNRLNLYFIFIYLFIYLFIIQPGGVKAMWPSLPLNQAGHFGRVGR